MTMKTTNIISNIVQLNVEDETNDLPKEVMAAISKNPTLKWIKFILTDDLPNANKQRIPQEEFANVISTGVHMPVKMAQGFVRDGHEFAVPIGSITGLVERGNRIEGIAGLWGHEFPGEVDLLKDMATSEEKPQLSWELFYVNDEVSDDGIQSLRNISLTAATVVGSPAYEGRTPITLIASKEEGSSDDTTTSNYKIVTEDYTNMEKELEKLTKERDDALEAKLALEEELKTLQSEHAELKEKFSTIEAEHVELAAFKAEIEAEAEMAAKLDSIKELFSSSGVELPADYLENEEKRESLLAMDINQLTFLLQELDIFTAASDEDAEESEEEAEEEEASIRIGSKVPNIKGEKPVEMSPKEIAEALKKAKSDK